MAVHQMINDEVNKLGSQRISAQLAALDNF
jgi:hypothetical protein